MINRPIEEGQLREGLRRAPIVLLLGPRQCGKTTLAKKVADQTKAAYFDLEDPEVSLPVGAAAARLSPLKGLVIIDECQRRPDLFSLLRVLADRRPLSARFLLLGSASPELARGVSESLAGRVAHVDLGGLRLTDVGPAQWEALWSRGGFPASFLAHSEEESHHWRGDFIRTFLERDIPQLGIRVPSATLRRFWTMLAHLHARTLNASELARSMGVQEATARHYLDILSGAFMLRQLPPWFENTGKRLVKAPKIYFRDTGLLHSLLGLRTREELLSHPSLGFSWEGFAMEEVIRLWGAERDAYFYGAHSGSELDLMLIRGGRRYGFEFKFGDAPSVTKSMHVVMSDLKLERLWVVYPGRQTYPLADRMTAVPLADIQQTLVSKSVSS